MFQIDGIFIQNAAALTFNRLRYLKQCQILLLSRRISQQPSRRPRSLPDSANLIHSLQF